MLGTVVSQTLLNIVALTVLGAIMFSSVNFFDGHQNALLVALGLGRHAGLGAAAAVLFAVNITAVLPATPANLGVFQAACAAVLHTGWHIGYGDAVAYGVILQAVEVTTAIVMGMPALLKEGMSWREVRLRAMHTTPVKLPARPSSRGSTSAGTVRAQS